MNPKELHETLANMRQVLLIELNTLPNRAKYPAAMYILNMLKNEIEFLGQTVNGSDEAFTDGIEELISSAFKGR